MLRSLIGGARNFSIHGHALTNNDISLKGTLIYFGLLLNRLVRHSLQPFPQQQQTRKQSNQLKQPWTSHQISSSSPRFDLQIHGFTLPGYYIHSYSCRVRSQMTHPGSASQIAIGKSQKKKNTGCLTLSELCFNLAGDNLSACENAKKNADNVMTFGLQVSYSLKGNSHCLGSTRIFPSVKCHQRNL